MKNSEKDDPVWKLLGKARRVEADSFFARNVVREVRKMQAEGADREGVFDTILSWFRQPVLAGLAAAAVILAVVFFSTESATNRTVVESVPEQPAAAQPGEFDEIEGIGYLRELMAISDPADLDDAALADLSLLASRSIGGNR